MFTINPCTATTITTLSRRPKPCNQRHTIILFLVVLSLSSASAFAAAFPNVASVTATTTTTALLPTDHKKNSHRPWSAFIKKKQTSAPTTTFTSSLHNMSPSNQEGTSASSWTAAAYSTTTAPTPTTTKKMRIAAFDALRGVLCVMIVLGHFILFANPPTVVLRFFSQHNTVPVAAFFLLSGYVSAYTSTENGAPPRASTKLLDTPKPTWILSRIFGFYPLHFFVLVLFAPMFLYTDWQATNGGPLLAAWHAVLSTTLTTAWFPSHAESWNAPTWYLSALAFATMILPYALPVIAQQDKKALRKTSLYLTLTSLLPKLAYVMENNVWTLAEGMTPPKLIPNYLAFNWQRFSPLGQVAEILLGAVACRLVMLDNTDDNDKDKSTKVNGFSTLWPLLGLGMLMVLRATGLLEMNDLLARTLIAVPLTCQLFMAVHRSAVQGKKDLVSTVLNNKVLLWLGNLAFPIYIVHGPIGQVFYKKLIATALWGKVLKGPGFFALYLVTTTLTAFALQKLFLQNKAVGNWSKATVDKLAAWM